MITHGSLPKKNQQVTKSSLRGLFLLRFRLVGQQHRTLPCEGGGLNMLYLFSCSTGAGPGTGDSWRGRSHLQQGGVVVEHARHLDAIVYLRKVGPALPVVLRDGYLHTTPTQVARDVSGGWLQSLKVYLRRTYRGDP